MSDWDWASEQEFLRFDASIKDCKKIMNEKYGQSMFNEEEENLPILEDDEPPQIPSAWCASFSY